MYGTYPAFVPNMRTATGRRAYRIALVIGTRPEAIKLAPVVAELRRRDFWFEPLVITTGQHTDMLAAALSAFHLQADVELDVERTSIEEFAAQCQPALAQVYRVLQPDLVVVQGDTTSALVGAAAASALGIPIAHVEAGLRSGDRMAPFPEEDNRCQIATMADLHFAPTSRAKSNLLREGISRWAVSVTGNTVVDALRQWNGGEQFESEQLRSLPLGDDRLVLATAHRREAQAGGIAGICRAIRRLVTGNSGLQFVFPVHASPRVRGVVEEELRGAPGVHCVEPVSHPDLLRLIRRSWLVMTDSGGIQEEAPSFGKPLLILRDTTERQEVVESGVGRLVGTCPDRIVAAVHELLQNDNAYERMSAVQNPFGDGAASPRIVQRIKHFLDARRLAESRAPEAVASRFPRRAVGDAANAVHVA